MISTSSHPLPHLSLSPLFLLTHLPAVGWPASSFLHAMANNSSYRMQPVGELPPPLPSCPSKRAPHPTHSEPTRSSLHVSRSVSPPIERSQPTISSPRATTGKVQPVCTVGRRAPALRSVAGSSSFHARLADELLLACTTSWGAPPPRVVAGQVLPVCVTDRRAPPLVCTWTELSAWRDGTT